MDVLGIPKAGHHHVAWSGCALKPFDKRLLRYASAARFFLAAGVAFSAVNVAGIVLFTGGLAAVISRSIRGEDLGKEIVLALGGLLLAVAGNFAQDLSAIRAGAQVAHELRTTALASMNWASLGRRREGEALAILTTGLDSVQPYFAKFLPQLIATAVATPLCIVTLWLIDPLSGLAVTVTLPLIPLFMILIGKTTAVTQETQWRVLNQLSQGFSDVVRGLSTLLLFGRAKRQIDQIVTVTDDYRSRTMSVLRLSFLSGFALEIGASLSVALVAVSIGLRLVDGTLELETGLWALLLAPEAFLAVRKVGAQFHASAAGITAMADVFDLIGDSRGREFIEPTRDRQSITLTNLRQRGAMVDSITVTPGSVILFVGASGVGKTSLLRDLRHGVPDLVAEKPSLAPAEIAWMPQGLSLVPGTVLDNIVMKSDVIDEGAVRDALALAAVSLDPTTDVGADGGALSGGEAARVAFARVVYRLRTSPAHIAILDEPTSSLNDELDNVIADSIGALASRGVTVFVASHRKSIRRVATQIVELAL